MRLPSRKKIPAERKWDRRDIFPTRAAFESYVARIPSAAAAGRIIRSNGWRAPRSSAALARLLGFMFKVNDSLSRAGSYCHLGHVVGDSERDESALHRVGSLVLKMEEQFDFVSDLIAEVWRSNRGWIFSAPMAPFRGYVRASLHIHKRQPRDPKARRAEGALSAVVQTLEEAATTAVFLDAVPESVRDSSGVSRHVSHANLGTLLRSGDRRLRRRAYLSVCKALAAVSQTYGVQYVGFAEAQLARARLHDFESVLDMTLDDCGLSRATHTAVLREGEAGLRVYHRWVRWNARALGLKNMGPWDRHAPMLGRQPQTRVSWKKASETILAALSPLGQDYVDVARRALLKERWFDWGIHDGKSDVPFATTVAGTHPYAMVNFDGSLGAMFEVAHELGHVVHFYLAGLTHPIRDVSFTSAVAEVASVVNETLLRNYLLASATAGRRAEVLAVALSSVETVFFRQLMWADFEDSVYKVLERGDALAVDELFVLAAATTRKWFGSGWQAGEHDELMWMMIPHFFDSHMVFQYATSHAVAEQIASDLEAGDRAALKRYRAFLSAGSYVKPEVALRRLGVDLSTGRPAKTAVARFDELLAEAEKLEARPRSRGASKSVAKKRTRRKT